jgi:hypothetical protein
VRIVRRVARIGLGLAVLSAAYLIFLVIAGWIAASIVADKIQTRLAGSLDAEVHVGDADVGLISGAVAIDNLHLERNRIDTLTLDIRRLEVDIAPMGWVVFDRAPRHVRVLDGRLTISGAGALILPPRAKQPPIRLGALTIENGVIDLMATGYWPGLARMVITIESAHADATTLRTGLSWLFTLQDLVARIDLPAGITVRIQYSDGKLSASGGFFGTTPVTIPFQLPVYDNRDEVAQLLAMGKELGKQLAIERAKRWLGAQLAK